MKHPTFLSLHRKGGYSMDDSKVYRHSAAVAQQNNELDWYRKNMKLNLACAEFIYQSIRQHYADSHLDPACVDMVLSAYSSERVQWVLAYTLQESDDGRFSRNNLEWAKGFSIPKSQNASFAVKTHPAILNGFLDLTRKAILEHALERENKNALAEPLPSDQRYTYYSILRPVDIGTIPMHPKPEKVINFDFRIPVENGAFQAWGYVRYHQPLTEKQIEDYELRPSSANPTEKTSLLGSLKTERHTDLQPEEKKKEARLTGHER